MSLIQTIWFFLILSLQLITLSSPKSSRKANSEETAAIGNEEKKGSCIMDVIDDGTTRDLNLVKIKISIKINASSNLYVGNLNKNFFNRC